MLQAKVELAPPGQRGFDCDSPVSPTNAKQFAAQGFRFCVRYLSRSDTPGSTDLSTSEAWGILSAGLALSAVQHPRSQGWLPSSEMGTADGNAAAKNAQAIGLPDRLNLWCDLEGVSEDASAQLVIDYCEAWYAAASEEGFVPGLYVGFDSILSGAQLFYDLKFEHYWKSASTAPDIPVRGYQMLQSVHSGLVNGLSIDLNVTQDDREGGQVMWCVLDQ
ncbi:MAG: glycoside hydrolase domain-containing protein [Pseudomonadota bacterium]